MPVLLYDLRANRLMNKTFFVHHLKIYDHSMVYEQRRFPFYKDETTVSYSHVSQVNLTKNLFFANLEIINTGGFENILIKSVGKRSASEAKNIIDAKIHSTHSTYAPHKAEDTHAEPGTRVVDNKALVRYKDLLNQGRISKKEYNKLLKESLRR